MNYKLDLVSKEERGEREEKQKAENGELEEKVEDEGRGRRRRGENSTDTRATRLLEDGDRDQSDTALGQ